MLGRRRQSIHGGFSPISPPKSLGSFTRNLGSSHGNSLSPRASSHNLTDSQNRLSSLVESPTSPETPIVAKEPLKTSHEGTNGVTGGEQGTPSAPPQPSSSILNGTAEDLFDAPTQAPPPTQPAEPAKDAEGFTIPVATDDPIAQAQREAADEVDQIFKLSIQKEPIAEEDQDAKQAALSNVANALTHMGMGMPNRKSGTVRGRRDVRNTVYMPASLPVPENSVENPFPPSPSLPPTTVTPKITQGPTFASETSHASDTQSIRSGTSVGGASAYSGIARLRHPDMHGPGYRPGLHASIIETVSALFEDGAVKSTKIQGEIALSYTPNPGSPSGRYTSRCICKKLIPDRSRDDPPKQLPTIRFHWAKPRLR